MPGDVLRTGLPGLIKLERRPSREARHVSSKPFQAQGGRKVEIGALISASAMVGLGPEPKIQSDPSNFPLNFEVGSRCTPMQSQGVQ